MSSSKKKASRSSKSPEDTEGLPDQFLFINKSAKSASLSNSNPGERFYIHSHVHSKHHKTKRQQKSRSPNPDKGSPDKSPSSSKIFTWQTSPSEASSSAATNANDASPNLLSAWSSWKDLNLQEPTDIEGSANRSRSPLLTPIYSPISGNTRDPFYVTSAPIDDSDQRLLSYVFTTFIEQTFKAESLASETEVVAPNNFRHRSAVDERLQKCVVDALTMYTTLTYCASCWRWAFGKDEEERPPEYYMVRAIEALRPRLQRADQVDPYLIQAIYALAVSEMWSCNYQPATTHLTMIRILIRKAGGFRTLKPYLMEGLLLCDKYTALGKFTTPIFYEDWEPEELPPGRLEEIRSHVQSFLSNFATGFLEASVENDEGRLSSELLTIIEDIGPCMHVAIYSRVQADLDPILQRWLFLQHQHIISRLLAFEHANQIQKCVQVALVIWLLKMTKYFGAQRWAKWLLTRLRGELLTLRTNDAENGGSPRKQIPLRFWMYHLGALSADDGDLRDWYLEHAVRSASSLGLSLDKDSIQRLLERFAFLKSETGVRFERLLNDLNEIEQAD